MLVSVSVFPFYGQTDGWTDTLTDRRTDIKHGNVANKKDITTKINTPYGEIIIIIIFFYAANLPGYENF